MRTTIVLVHGAFAESASWDGVIEPLVAEGHRVIPTELQRYMAHRAGTQRTSVIEGASHAMPVSRPDATVHPILEAAALRMAA